jgi:hypothetical protein
MIREAKQPTAFDGFNRPSADADRELNLSVGTLSPIFNDWNENPFRKSIDDLAGFATSRLNRQRRYL